MGGRAINSSPPQGTTNSAPASRAAAQFRPPVGVAEGKFQPRPDPAGYCQHPRRATTASASHVPRFARAFAKASLFRCVAPFSALRAGVNKAEKIAFANSCPALLGARAKPCGPAPALSAPAAARGFPLAAVSVPPLRPVASRGAPGRRSSGGGATGAAAACRVVRCSSRAPSAPLASSLCPPRLPRRCSLPPRPAAFAPSMGYDRSRLPRACGAARPRFALRSVPSLPRWPLLLVSGARRHASPGALGSRAPWRSAARILSVNMRYRGLRGVRRRRCLPGWGRCPRRGLRRAVAILRPLAGFCHPAPGAALRAGCGGYGC